MFIQNAENITYLTGFSYGVSARPYGLLLSGEKCALIIPRIAVDMAHAVIRDIDLSIYYEQPEGKKEGASFQAALSNTLSPAAPGEIMGIEAGRISASDYDLLTAWGFKTQDIGGYLTQMRAVKDPGELDNIRTAGQYVDLNIEISLASIRPGITEMEIDQAGIQGVNQEIDALGMGVPAGFYSFTVLGAARTAMPHAYPSMSKLRPGDPVVFCRQITINNYNAQCDRVAYWGKPNKEQIKYHSLILAAREAALEAIRPGIPACKVDLTIREVFAQAGVSQYCVHRSGSGIGIGRQEAPYLSFNNQELILADMALIVQPALYIPGVGGFRCTDTVIVEKDGMEKVTKYPRDIKSLIL